MSLWGVWGVWCKAPRGASAPAGHGLASGWYYGLGGAGPEGRVQFKLRREVLAFMKEHGIPDYSMRNGYSYEPRRITRRKKAA